VYAVSATVVLVFFISLAYGVVLISRQEEADEKRAKNWPQPLPLPPDPVILRREVWRLDGHLKTFRAPLSRQQSDKARWAASAILANATEIRRRALRGRQAWLMTDKPRRLVGYQLWTTAIVGFLAAALMPQVLNHIVSPVRASLSILGGAAAICLIAAAILELDYRWQRLQARNVAAEVTSDAERLTRRLEELLQPPAWETTGTSELTADRDTDEAKRRSTQTINEEQAHGRGVHQLPGQGQSARRGRHP
jgi:hypothetical protein